MGSNTNSKYKYKYNFKYRYCCTYLSIPVMKRSLMPIEYVYIWNDVIMIVIVLLYNVIVIVIDYMNKYCNHNRNRNHDIIK